MRISGLKIKNCKKKFNKLWENIYYKKSRNLASFISTYIRLELQKNWAPKELIYHACQLSWITVLWWKTEENVLFGNKDKNFIVTLRLESYMSKNHIKNMNIVIDISCRRKSMKMDWDLTTLVQLTNQMLRPSFCKKKRIIGSVIQNFWKFYRIFENKLIIRNSVITLRRVQYWCFKYWDLNFSNSIGVFFHSARALNMFNNETMIFFSA